MTPFLPFRQQKIRCIPLFLHNHTHKILLSLEPCFEIRQIWFPSLSRTQFCDLQNGYNIIIPHLIGCDEDAMKSATLRNLLSQWNWKPCKTFCKGHHGLVERVRTLVSNRSSKGYDLSSHFLVCKIKVIVTSVLQSCCED